MKCVGCKRPIVIGKRYLQLASWFKHTNGNEIEIFLKILHFFTILQSKSNII